MATTKKSTTAKTKTATKSPKTKTDKTVKAASKTKKTVVKKPAKAKKAASTKSGSKSPKTKVASKKLPSKTPKTSKKTAQKAKKLSVNSLGKNIKSKSFKLSKPKSAKITMSSLNKWNYGLAALHFVQAATIIIFSRSTNALFPLNVQYLTTDELAKSAEGGPVLVSAVRTVADVNLAYIVAAFFLLSSLAHLIVATWQRKKYESELNQGINRFRWFEYALSASTMMIGIAMLVGIYEFSTLALIFIATATMNLCGLIMELWNKKSDKPNWTSFWVGTLIGLAPWLAVTSYLWDSSYYGSGQIPTFVYWIFGSMFVFFSSFAVNMWLQYKKVGQWKNYLYGERAYMILSLVAKSALAWQIFFGALRP